MTRLGRKLFVSLVQRPSRQQTSLSIRCISMWTLREVGRVIPWKEGHRYLFKRYRSAGANQRLSTNWTVKRA